MQANFALKEAQEAQVLYWYGHIVASLLPVQLLAPAHLPGPPGAVDQPNTGRDTPNSPSSVSLLFKYIKSHRASKVLRLCKSVLIQCNTEDWFLCKLHIKLAHTHSRHKSAINFL